MVTIWLLGKWPLLDEHEFALFVAALCIDVIAFATVAMLLLTSHSSGVRGLSVSIAGTSAMLLIGGATFAFVLEGR
ncbi:hypothetical protein [Mycobacterium kyorinense]|nr:hypothetical protein [Mycobacterium kyorinense]